MVGEIVFPVGRLDLEGALSASLELEQLPPADLYTIDFAQLNWVEPFGMLYFARQLRAFGNRRKPARCRAINHERHGYAAYMGFFQAFGLSFGNSSGQAPATDRYIPLTEVLIRNLHIEAGQSSVDVREVIEGRARQMAAVLARSEGGHVHQTLSYSLRELLRNVVEHANADHLWYCAQYWPNKAQVELAIVDHGCGILSTLSRNPHLNIRTDEEALRLALLPGVSGVAFKGARPRRTDEWANSGYGLFMTSELCARGGSFMICSGSTAVLRKGNRERVLLTLPPKNVVLG